MHIVCTSLLRARSPQTGVRSTRHWLVATLTPARNRGDISVESVARHLKSLCAKCLATFQNISTVTCYVSTNSLNLVMLMLILYSIRINAGLAYIRGCWLSTRFSLISCLTKCGPATLNPEVNNTCVKK